MKNLNAFLPIGVFTLSVAALLFLVDAHQNFRNIYWALGISLTLIITHITNMAIYFKVAGDKPYKWFKEMVPRGGIEPPTQGFSILCSTD